MNASNRTPPPTWTAALVLTVGAPLALGVTILAALLVALLLFKTIRDFESAGLVYGTVTLAVIYLALIFAAALIVRASRIRLLAVPVMFMAASCSIAAFTLWAVLMWADDLSWQVEDSIIASAVSLTIVTLALLHNGLFTCLFIRTPALRSAAIVVSIAAWCVVLPLVGALGWAMFYDDELPLMIIGPFVGILSVFVLLATGLLPALIRRSNAKWEAARDSVSERTEIALECPKCGESQRLRSGSRLCRACGLLLSIEIEEPRCECGYLLYRLQSSACPECGRVVPLELRAKDEAPAES